MALTLGAFKVGIATTETLAGGPPSVDLTYVLPEAKSAICFALAFNQSLIDPYFRKEDHKALETNKVRITTLANGVALEIAGFLQQYGYKAVPQSANFVYRMDYGKLADGYAPSDFPQVPCGPIRDRAFRILRQHYYKGVRVSNCTGLGSYGRRTDSNRPPAGRRKLL